MSALTPDCDPDLSNCGSPVGSGTGSLRSNVIVLAVLAASLSLATGGAAPGAVAFMSGGVALVSALVLGRRCVRLGQRLATAAADHAPWGVHRSRPVG
jgi:hypothetical protein